jgi:hypothetical protein
MSAIRSILLAAAATASLALSTAALRADDANGYRVYTKAAKYENVRDDLKDAIINKGFVIDYTGQFNAMLERTADVARTSAGNDAKSPYSNAEYMQFCPSKLTHEAVSASPHGIANCPIALFVYELRTEPGKIVVGFRLPVGSPSKKVKAVNKSFVTLLDGIAREVTKK